MVTGLGLLDNGVGSRELEELDYVEQLKGGLDNRRGQVF